MGATGVVSVSTSTDWTALAWSFGAAIGASCLFVVWIYSRWRITSGTRERTREHLLSPLTGLSASWSFHDSWATNITAGSGLIVLVLGSSDVLKGVLGANSQGAINVATVAGAVSIALIGASGVLVLTIKRAIDSDTTVGGLLAGTSVALGAATGEVWAIAVGLNQVTLGGAGDFLKWIAAGLATLLLTAYAWTSITGLLTQGATAAAPHTTIPAGGDTGSPAGAPEAQSPVEAVAAAIVQASQNQPLDHREVLRAVNRFRSDFGAVRPTTLRERSALP